MSWQPIETAPKDGSNIFLWTGDSEFPRRYEGSWREPTESEYWCNGSDEPCPKDGTFGPEAGWFVDDVMTFKLHGDYTPTHWHRDLEPPK